MNIMIKTPLPKDLDALRVEGGGGWCLAHCRIAVTTRDSDTVTALISASDANDMPSVVAHLHLTKHDALTLSDQLRAAADRLLQPQGDNEG